MYGSDKNLLYFYVALIFVAIPLAAWKLIDILLWLLANVQIGLR